MKKIITIGVFFMLLAWMQAYGQVAVSGCNYVIVTDKGINHNKPRTTSGPLIYVLNGFPYATSTSCGVIALTYVDLSVTQYTLRRLDENTGYYEYFDQNKTGQFYNVPIGTYIVDIFDAAEEDNYVCNTKTWPLPGQGDFIIGTRPVYNQARQLLGYSVQKGINPFWSGADGDHRLTTPVLVGQSRLVDNNWTFIPPSGISMSNNLPVNGVVETYSVGDVVKIDATATKNYDQYWLAIQEFRPDGSQGRWLGKGNSGRGDWIKGSLGVVNLSEFWSGILGWTFVANNTYRVQVVIRNSNCPTWTQVLQTFLVCPSAFYGCRVGSEPLLQDFAINPNPVSNKFNITGLNFDVQKNYKVAISDVSGKIVQNFEQVTSNEFDISDLSNGLYIVELYADDKRIFSKKLVVSK